MKKIGKLFSVSYFRLNKKSNIQIVTKFGSCLSAHEIITKYEEII